MNVLIGEIIMCLGFILLILGVVLQLKNAGFYKRILLASVIDSAAVIMIFVGVMIRQGFNSFSLKVLVILIIMLAINPLATHKLTRSAHLSHLGEKHDY